MQKINTINFKINNVMLNNSKFFSYFKDTINTTLTLLISSGKNSTWKNEGAEFTRLRTPECYSFRNRTQKNVKV